MLSSIYRFSLTVPYLSVTPPYVRKKNFRFKDYVMAEIRKWEGGVYKLKTLKCRGPWAMQLL